MRELFGLSFALLWVVVVLEAAVLQEVLRGTAAIRRRYSGSRETEPRQLVSGTPAPEFIAKVFGSKQTIGTSDLNGHSTILLFISPHDKASPLYDELALGTHALWHKAHGRLYLVCSGSEQSCRRLMRDHPVEGFDRGHVPLILDEDRSMAESFLVKTTPLAVMLDEEARVSRYGHPRSSGEIADGGG